MFCVRTPIVKKPQTSGTFPVRSLKVNSVRHSSTHKFPSDWAKLAQKELKTKPLEDLVWKTAEVFLEYKMKL
jgi:hypothetical protein